MSRVDWKSQTVVLTGASGGLGTQLAEQLSAKRAKLLLLGRSKPELCALAERLHQDYFVVDLRENDAVTKLRAFIEQQNLDITGLINNAATTHEGLFEETEVEDIQRVIATNLTVPLTLIHSLLPQLRASHGWVMNIGSVFGAIGFPGQTLYCASKFGLRGFGEALHRELESDDVQILHCAPRAIQTQLNKGVIQRLNQQLKASADKPEWVAKQIIHQIEQQQPLKTLGWPEKLFTRLNGLLPELVNGSMKKPRALLHQLIKEKSL
ncbi:SDR family oxidoreductase [Idiomarina sp. HP20-50]|uniref:SDR family oxidoreductase n=1 Tax=Idiomarina sp. HP20-50 TaxID=3070813 RepID=UPI00294B0423|nr:SDR family oxidoreductase [Idiomarina sp. HP20-50]MDV6316425.1 SDR family oxidoreductase [Idiomarina sp. HP20-50]